MHRCKDINIHETYAYTHIHKHLQIAEYEKYTYKDRHAYKYMCINQNMKDLKIILGVLKCCCLIIL